MDSPPQIELTWDDVFNYVDNLTNDINNFSPTWHPDRIVAIARGGLIPATLLGHQMSIDNIDALNIQFGRRYVEALHEIFIDSADTGDKILIVDDIVDTGATIERLWRDARELCETHHTLDTWHFQVKFAAFVHNTKAHTAVNPHFAGHRFEKTNQWIVFPWETKHSTARKQKDNPATWV